MLKKDTTRKKCIDENMTKLEFGNNKKYKIKTIWDSSIYANKVKGHLPGVYYRIAWKRYLKEENTWELSFAVQQIKKLINFFYKKHPEILAATSPPINSASTMARSAVKPRPIIKWK